MFNGDIAKGEWQKVRIFAFIVAAMAAALYLPFVRKTAFPGPSADEIVVYAGMFPASLSDRPLLMLIGKILAFMPWPSGTAFRFNLFSALLGIALIPMTLRFVWWLIRSLMDTDWMRDDAPGAALCGGCAAALLTMFSIPIWVGATRFTPGLWDALLWIGAINLFISLIKRSDTQKLRGVPLGCFAAMYGIGCAESCVFIMGLPFVVFMMMYLTEGPLPDDENGLEGYGESSMGQCFCVMALAYLADKLLLVGLALPDGWSQVNSNVFIKLFGISVIKQFMQLWPGISSHLLSIAMFTTIAVLALGLLCAYQVFRGIALYRLNADETEDRTGRQQIRFRFLVVLGSVAMLGAGLYLMAGGKGSPWDACAHAGKVPVLTSSLIAIVTAMLFTAVVEIPHFLKNGTHEEHKPFPVGILSIAAVVSVAIGVFAFPLVREDIGPWILSMATGVLDHLEGRTWILAQKETAPYLRLVSHDRKQELLILYDGCSFSSSRRLELQKSLRPNVSESAWESISQYASGNPMVYLQDFFMEVTNLNQRLAIVSNPDVWRQCNWEPEPSGFFYGGVKIPAPQINDKSQSWQAAKTWMTIVRKMLENRPDPYTCGRRTFGFDYVRRISSLFSMMANNIGVSEERNNRWSGAMEDYGLALAIAPDNASTLLNLIRLGEFFKKAPEGKPAFPYDVDGALFPRLSELTRGRNCEASLWALSRRYGYVRDPLFFITMDMPWAISGNQLPISEMLRLSLSTPAKKVPYPRYAQRIRTSLGLVFASNDEDGHFSQASLELNLAKTDLGICLLTQITADALQTPGINAKRAALSNSDAYPGESAKLSMEYGLYCMSQGKASLFEGILNSKVKSTESPISLALESALLCNLGQVDKVKSTLLPRLRAISTGKDAFYCYIVEGKVAEIQSKEGWIREAKTAYAKAYALRPDCMRIGVVVKQLERWTNDPASAPKISPGL